MPDLLSVGNIVLRKTGSRTFGRPRETPATASDETPQKTPQKTLQETPQKLSLAIRANSFVKIRKMKVAHGIFDSKPSMIGAGTGGINGGINGGIQSAIAGNLWTEYFQTKNRRPSGGPGSVRAEPTGLGREEAFTRLARGRDGARPSPCASIIAARKPCAHVITPDALPGHIQEMDG